MRAATPLLPFPAADDAKGRQEVPGDDSHAAPKEAGDMYRPLVDDGIVRRLLAAAAAAPSIHNTQPWRLRVAGHDVIEVHGDPDRVLWVADPRGRALHLSCGAALFNLRLAIRAAGAKPLVWPLPDPAREPTLIASVRLGEGRPPG